MNSERWQSILEQGGVLDLSGRAKWRLVGEDRVRYLHGQVTNDVRRASAAAAVYACVTDGKGKIVGDVQIRVTDDGAALLLDAEADLREVLAQRLERYMVADDVELEDVSEQWALCHVFGAAAEAWQGRGTVAQRLGRPGVDVWVAQGEPRPEFGGVQVLDEEEMEILRVIQAVPRHPAELNAETFPAEAGLEGRAVDFAKGCYLGQEIISRIKTTGKMPRRLVHWLAAEGGGEVLCGDEVLVEQGGELKPCGQVTSVVRDPRGGGLCGLAFVKASVLSGIPEDSLLRVGGKMVRVQFSVLK